MYKLKSNMAKVDTNFIKNLLELFMFVEGLHEKDIFTKEFPFRLEINTEVDFTYPVHWHGAIELLYVEKNRFNINVNNSEYELEEGDILFIANGDTHGFLNQKNEGRRIFIQFDSSAFNALGSNNILKPLISNSFKITRQEQPFHTNLVNQITGIVDSYTEKIFGFQLFLSARIYDVLSIISNYLVDRVKPGSTQDTIKKMQGLEKLSEAFKYIEANYMNDISLSDVAKAVGFSEFYFSRIFKDITEKNFSLYLNEYRIKQAEHYLIKPGMSVADIAYTVGFNSIVTFNRSFKTVKGCSPSTYKKIGI